MVRERYTGEGREGREREREGKKERKRDRERELSEIMIW